MRVTYESLPDGNSDPFRVVNVGMGESDDPAMQRVVWANGYLEGPEVLQPFAEAVVDHAWQRGVPLQITMHDSPDTGSSAYGFSYRTERYVTVAQHVMRNGDRIRTGGHSWGSPTSVVASNRLLDEGQPVDSMLGMAPNGHTPARLSRENVSHLVKGGWHEFRRQSEAISGQRVLSRLGASALLHAVPHPIRAVSELSGVLTADYTNDAVELSRKFRERYNEQRVIMALCELDPVCPGSIARRNLVAAGFPLDGIVMLDASHSGPIKEARLVAPVVDAMLLRRSEDAVA